MLRVRLNLERVTKPLPHEGVFVGCCDSLPLTVGVSPPLFAASELFVFSVQPVLDAQAGDVLEV